MRKQEPQKSKSIRLRAGFADRLDLLAARDAMDVSEAVNLAVREMLERRGLWPIMSDEWLQFERDWLQQKKSRRTA